LASFESFFDPTNGNHLGESPVIVIRILIYIFNYLIQSIRNLEFKIKWKGEITPYSTFALVFLVCNFMELNLDANLIYL